MPDKKSYWDFTKEDFPENEPVLKMKRGYWYRDNNRGYSESILYAGVYDKEEALRDCFTQDGKNGCCDVLAVPIRRALKDECSLETIEFIKKKMETFLKYM